MRRTVLAALLAVTLAVVAARPVDARMSAAELLQPLVAELDVRLAALADATSEDEVELRADIAALRTALAQDLSSVTDAQALAAIKKAGGRIVKAFPGDATFAGILTTALDGFAAAFAEARTSLNSRADALGDPALQAKARKGLAKLDAALASAAAPGLVLKKRAKALGTALKRVNQVENTLAPCPGHPGEFGHGQVVAFLAGTELFKPKFASGELVRDAGGTPLTLDLDGFHFPYAKGTVALTITAPVQGNSYSFGAANLAGSYQEDDVYFFMDAGTLTLDVFDAAARRASGRFEFTAATQGTSDAVTLTSGTFSVCDFKVTTQ